MNFFKPLSASSKNSRKGVFLLLLLIVIIQSVYWKRTSDEQSQLASLVDVETEALISKAVEEQNTIKLNPFNANYLNDYRAYVLGISSDQLQRIESYRSSRNYFYNLSEFQEISGINDSLINQIKPFLIFPSKKKFESEVKKVSDKKDINTATAEELKKIYGIGAVYSKRIVSYRTSLGGFKSMNELYKVYGLDSIVVQRIMNYYKIVN